MGFFERLARTGFGAQAGGYLSTPPDLSGDPGLDGQPASDRTPELDALGAERSPDHALTAQRLDDTTREAEVSPL